MVDAVIVYRGLEEVGIFFEPVFMLSVVFCQSMLVIFLGVMSWPGRGTNIFRRIRWMYIPLGDVECWWEHFAGYYSNLIPSLLLCDILPRLNLIEIKRYDLIRSDGESKSCGDKPGLIGMSQQADRKIQTPLHFLQTTFFFLSFCQ